MLCEEIFGKAVPVKAERSSLNSSAPASSVDAKASNISWSAQVRAENGDEDSSAHSHSSLNSSSDDGHGHGQCDASDATEMKPIKSKKREIALQFIEGANEAKFERLVREEKLKTPFKRRHSITPSDDSRSNSPDSNKNHCDADGNGGTDSAKGKTKDRGNGSGFNGEDVASSSSSLRSSNTERDVPNWKKEKRLRHNSQASAASSGSSSSYTERDPATLARRQKQIDYGKNTVAYERYMETVPRTERKREHPHTPDKYGKYSRRAFDGLVKIWRKQLHYYDPPEMKQSGTAGDQSEDSDSE